MHLALVAEPAGPGARILASPKYLEPLFVFVIMVIASSRPIFSTASGLLNRLARSVGGSPLARWAVVLTVAPLLGSLITEPAAMTIAALMLSAQFPELKPSMRLRYATLGLLFVRSTDRADRLQLAADLRGGDLGGVVAPEPGR